MKAFVCYKWVPDEADIVVNQSTRTLNMEKVKYKISDYDRNAIELGATLNENNGFAVEAITVGRDVKASIKDALARGMQKAFYVESGELESAAAAKVLCQVIEKNGGADLILCGEGSGDQYSQQVGPRLAALLNYDLVTYVSSLQVDGEELTLERKLEDGLEIVKVSGPTVITVLSEINTPRIPGMKQILSAKKKPAEELQLANLGLENEQLEPTIEVRKIGPSIMERKNIRLNNGSTSIDEAVQQLIDQLKAHKDL